MKCPKCAYLGFETGDRCKNCGYDFSLLSTAESDPSDFIHRASSDEFDDVPPGSSKEPDYVFRTDDDVSIQVNGDLDPYDRWFDDRRQPPGGRQEAEAESAASSPVVHLVPASIREALPLFTPSQHLADEPLFSMTAAPRSPLAFRRTSDSPRLRVALRSFIL